VQFSSRLRIYAHRALLRCVSGTELCICVVENLDVTRLSAVRSVAVADTVADIYTGIKRV